MNADAPSTYAQNQLTAQNCSNIVESITASEGSTITLNIAAADCSGGDAKLRVTYFWLDGLATGHVLAGFLPPNLRQALGRDYPVVRNDVFDEVSSLFERFGQTVDVPTDDEVVVQACFGTGRFDENGELVECGDNQARFYRAGATTGTEIRHLPDINFFVPLQGTEAVVANTDRWPPNFNFSYDWYNGDLDYPPLPGERMYMPPLTLWRPAERSDVRNLRRRIRSYVRDFVEKAEGGLEIAGFPVLPVPTSQDERRSQSEWFSERTSAESQGARLLEFISRGADLANLAFVYGTSVTCGDAWQLQVRGPEFRLLIGVVENAGDKAVTLSQIDVWSADRTELRRLPEGDTPGDEEWSEDKIVPPVRTLSPGDGMIIPMRIEFRSDIKQYMHTSDGETYEAIRDLPPDTPLFFYGGDLFKTARSFGPHSEAPPTATFAYGPEVRLKQARLANQEVALRQVDPTAISMFVGYERGSCPFVYGFDSDRGRWQLQSRAIVGATSPALAYEDSFEVGHFDGRLKIVELEPEVSFLDDISVDATLADGTVRRLLPDDWRLRSRDGTNLVIAYPDTAEIAFPGFASIDEPVRSVEVRVFGYYREFGVPLRMVATAGVRGPICDPAQRRSSTRRAMTYERL